MFCCNFSLWFCSLENLFVARLVFVLLYTDKQFSFSLCCASGKCSKFETTPERCFHKAITSNFSFVFVMLTKCCIFAIKTESWLLSKLFISSVSGEYRIFFEKTLGFWVSLVIVTLVGSREGLVEPLLWSFVIAPLLSFFFKLL